MRTFNAGDIYILLILLYNLQSVLIKSRIRNTVFNNAEIKPLQNVYIYIYTRIVLGLFDFNWTR